jgi:hypothetical protein
MPIDTGGFAAAKGPAPMDIINPLANTLLESTQVQRQQSAEKQRQLRRNQSVQKNVAPQDDQLEHQVESSEELPPAHDEQPEHEQQKQRKRRGNATDADSDEDDRPRLDLTA